MKKIIIPALALALLLIFSLLAGAASSDASVPVAENLELTTYRGVSMGGKLSAVDPDGGSLTFEICTPPSKGEIELGDDGHFVYTPFDGRRGKDYFGYRAIDSDGNRSQEATVIIRIQKQKTKVTYSDMSGSGSEYAAVYLAEHGIFVGESLASSYIFSPETSVTRSEFLVMCMKLADMAPLADVSSTGFSDDEEICAWARPYVSAALQQGLIAGYSNPAGAAVFDSDGDVSALEAAVILDRALDLTDAVAVWSLLDGGIPAWANQSAVNLISCDILPHNLSLTESSLNRSQASELLANAALVLEARQK